MLAQTLKEQSKQAHDANTALEHTEQLKASMEYTGQYNIGVQDANQDLPTITDHLMQVAQEGAVTLRSSYQEFRSPQLPAYYAGYAQTVVEHFQKEGLNATLLVAKHKRENCEAYYNFSFEFSW
jgi:hypothetical protein